MSNWYKSKPTKANLYMSNIGVVKKVGTQELYKDLYGTHDLTTINKSNLKQKLASVKVFNKLFVPTNCLQGNELPVHMLWPKNKIIKIKIIKPDSFKVVRVNNVENIVIKENEIYVDDFEENGFLGIIFKTEILKEPSQDVDISFIINCDIGTSIETRKIHLFRPNIKLITQIPKKIKIYKDSNNNYYPENRINIINDGEGIGIISFRTLEDSEISLELPKGSKDFIINFWTDLSLSLTELKSKYPQHDEAIEGLLFIGKTPIFQLTDEKIEQLKNVNEKLNNSLECDKDFSKDIEEAVTVAFMKNLRLMKTTEDFITYLKSIESNKIILNNPINVLKVVPEKKVKAEIEIIDRNYKSYSPIKIEFKFELDKEISGDSIELPLHNLLNLNYNSTVVQ